MRAATSIKDYKKFASNDEFNAAIDMRFTETAARYIDPYGRERVVPNRKVIVREEDGSPVSIVGKNFQYVQPKDHILSCLEMLGDEGVEYKPRNLHVHGNGHRITAVLDLPQFKMFSGTDEEQVMQFLVDFYFNALGSDKGMLGMLRMICTNGQMAFDEEMSYKLHHKGDMTKKANDAIELYKNFDGVYRQNIKIIERLSQSNGRKDLVETYIGDSEFSPQPIFDGERWAEKIREEWESLGEPTNLWDLYNMFTSLISHSYGRSYSSKMIKMDKLNRDVAMWHKRFGISEYSLVA